MAGRVRSKREGAIGWIIFDHPERRNALSPNMWKELAEAARRLDANPEVRVVVMRGAGETSFASGADISSFSPASRADTASDLDVGGGNAFHALEQLDKPLLALIHGYCIGGGLAVALFADMRYAADDARFSIPAARLGVGYDIGGVEMLARTVGFSAAQEILMSARRYDAGEALAMGLVNRVLPKAELDAAVREMAERIAGNAPLTVRSVKRVARELSKPPRERDITAARDAVAACFESDDFQEGVKAFLEKRSPVFRGR